MSLTDHLKLIFGKHPAMQPSQASTGQPVQNTSSTPTQPQKKVLIVEDDSVLANALELKFQHSGFAVFKASNGQIGLDLAAADKPDVIILDLQMPVMDGKTMLRNLRTKPEFKALPVIVLTNAGDVDNIKETQTYFNASEFLIKSNVNPDDILNIAQKYTG